MTRRELLSSFLFGFIPVNKRSESPVYMFDANMRLKETVAREHFCIFEYRKGQDTSKIVGTPIHIFRTQKSLDYFLNSYEGKEYRKVAESKKITLIVRPVTICI